MPRVRAVPWARFGPIAGEPVDEASLSDSSESSTPSFCRTERLWRPDPDRLKRLLSSTEAAAFGMTDETIIVRMVRWRSFRSGSAGPPRRLMERFCRRCSRDIETSVRSRSASFNSYRYGVYSLAAWNGRKELAKGEGRKFAFRSGSSIGRPSNGWERM